MALYLQILGNIDGAREHFLRAVAIDPDLHKAHYSLGNIFKAQDNIDKAEEHYQKTLEAKPNYAQAHFYLGMINFSKKNNPQQAFKYFENALRYNPKFAETFIKMADMLSKKEPDHAITLLKLVLKSKPGNKNLAEQIQKRLTLYKKNQPYAEQLRKRNNTNP